ncbi:MAG: hypothetical protein KDA81_19370, partial [Planctomycetaceae bacterium]|nr:hypothetical protein [Planctomycetaceae bacterium]
MRHSRQTIVLCGVVTLVVGLCSSVCRADSRDPSSFVVKTYVTEGGQSYFATAFRGSELGTSVQRHVIVVDTSASQVGRIRESFLKIAEGVLQNLPVTSTVSLFAADITCDSLTDGFVAPNSPEARKGLASLSHRTPLGSTNLRTVLKTVAAASRAGEALSVLYIGDGLTTANLISPEQINQFADQSCANRLQFHSIVLGPKTDLELPGILANLTGGTIRRLEGGTEAEVSVAAASSLQSEPVQITEISAGSPNVRFAAPRISWLRSDRDTVYFGEGTSEQLTGLTVKLNNGQSVSWKNSVSEAGGAEIFHLAARAMRTHGTDVPVAGLDVLEVMHYEFADSVRKSIAAS